MKHKSIALIIIVITLIQLFVLSGCSSTYNCPVCQEKLNPSKQSFCNNCGMQIMSKAEGYKEPDDVEEVLSKKNTQVRVIYTPQGYSTYLYAIDEYDKNDNLAKNTRYNSSGDLISYTLFTYDKKGRLIEEERYDDNDFLTSTTEYTYDKYGNKETVITYNSVDSISSKTTYEYYEEDDEVEENCKVYSFETYNGRDELTSDGEIGFNEDGNLVYKFWYSNRNAKNPTVHLTRNTYSNGKLDTQYNVEISYYDFTVKDSSYWEYRYNDDGKLISKVCHEHNLTQNYECMFEILIYNPDGWSEFIERDREMQYYKYEYE